jgi:hypothetical protein
MSFWRILQYLIVGTLVGIAPLVVASLIWGAGVLAVGFYGLFAGIAAIGNHRRLGLIATALLAVGGGLAVSFAWSPLLGALLFAGIGVVIGMSTRWHLQSIVGTIGIGIGFLIVVPPTLPWFPPPTAFDAGYSLAVAGILAGTGVWTVLAYGYLTRKMPSRPREPIPERTIYYFTIALAVALFVGTYIVLRWYPGGTGAWLIMTILIVLQPDWDTLRTKTLHRIFGTLLGVAIAAILVLVIPPNLHALVGLPLILGALAYKQGGVYWRYTTVLTPGVVLLVTQGLDQSKALTTDATRLAFTLGAIAVVVVVATLLGAASRVGRSSSRVT